MSNNLLKEWSEHFETRHLSLNYTSYNPKLKIENNSSSEGAFSLVNELKFVIKLNTSWVHFPLLNFENVVSNVSELFCVALKANNEHFLYLSKHSL